MSLNLDDLSVDELEKLIKQAEAKLEKKRMEAVKEAKAMITKIAKQAGVSVNELLKDEPKKKATSGKKAAKKKPGVRRPAKVKYRNTADSSQTWTGRGKRPLWLQDALAKGAKLESFAVGDSE